MPNVNNNIYLLGMIHVCLNTIIHVVALHFKVTVALLMLNFAHFAHFCNNPLSPNRDENEISLYIITTCSNN